jgi:hypothetical protein
VKTLRAHIKKWYELALKEVIKIIKKNGYASWRDVHDALQKHFSRFERYYVKKYRVDPFSEEFVDLVFDEFYKKVREIPGMNVVLLEEGIVTPDGEREIYGFGDVRKIFYENEKKHIEKIKSCKRENNFTIRIFL